MRIALVSPYSWTYPGGVTRHIGSLAECFLSWGHEVRVLAPFDPPDRLSATLHRGAEPEPTLAPPYLVTLGRTVGVRANGAVSNLSLTPGPAVALHRELCRGGYDVVHIHEPIAPAIGWMAVDWTPLPLVGTFHTYNQHWFSHGIGSALGARRMLNRLHVRIAVSHPAAWTAQRYFGGHYRVIPNGVAYDTGRAARNAARVALSGDRPRLKVVFVGQPVARKGLPVLLRAFEALQDRGIAQLTLIGPSPAEVAPLLVHASLVDAGWVRALGKVDDETKRRELEAADVLCAPSLGGESFGMVLTEAFAAGTPVVASDIAGYREVVREDVDGVLVPPGDAQAIADALYTLWADPSRQAEMGAAAVAGVERFAWPRVADEVLEAYDAAIATPAPTGRLQRAAVRVGVLPADLKPRAPARHLPPPEPRSSASARSGRTVVRRTVLVALSLAVAALAVLAVRKMGWHHVTEALAGASPGWLVFGLAAMCASMVLRAVSWWAALKASRPAGRLRIGDAMAALFIGVLVSSILPANLGEPSRALVIARRTGQSWQSLPVVAGTLVSQSLLNVAVLLVLGAITFLYADLFAGQQVVLIGGAVLAAAVLAVVLLAPVLLSDGSTHPWVRRAHRIATDVREGMLVFRRARFAAITVGGQVGAWAVQLVAVYVMLVGLHLQHRAGLLGAVAVLFATNVTILLPITPGDVGVYQAAVAAVL
ncbi:MAG: flippase-like domain-containing protein, partial [Acidimicrobiaceae bacterium]|nr:flippase-like domain-containing protein [Acidimicrobiaceae bacterium]